ncbi:hypothetical protein HK103_004447 [Boothiomyces macroporosus]|uniref:Uncharacterized protein n=1 Tax=Boothiomyces macroporosus TaxID=261099 RepID=A0AAD5UH30_9FUNG|nr:hypothetical protein HK103_004447 [Boothiomyces macroporosus]
MILDKSCQFDQKEWKAVELGVNKCLRFLRLKFTNNSYTPSENFTKEILIRPEYEEFYRGLRYFLALIGDWNSFLILLDNAPKKIPSISPENIVMFVKWKTFDLDTVFFDVNGNAVCDRYGNLVTPQKGWLNNNKVPKLLEAIEELHKTYFLTGPYDEMCRDCFKIYQSSQNHGCDDHFKEPKPFRRGNPIESIAVSSSLQVFREGKKGGSDKLTPMDLLKLREKLLEAKSLLHLQAWIIVLLSVKQFLRIEEIAFNTGTPRPTGIMVESFDPSLTVYKDGEVSGGFLFPSLQELSHPPASGRFTSSLKVGDLVDTIVHTVRQFRPGFEFGLETFVKSGYTLAIWGGGELEHIKKSARHHDTEDVNRFDGDSHTQLSLVKEQGTCVERITSKWNPILIEESEAARALIDVQKGQTLYQIAASYIEKKCKYEPSNIYDDVITCIEQCISTAEKPSRLHELLDKSQMSDEDRALLMLEIEKHVSKRVEEGVNNRIAIWQKEEQLKKQIVDGSFSPGSRQSISPAVNDIEIQNNRLEEELEKERQRTEELKNRKAVAAIVERSIGVTGASLIRSPNVSTLTPGADSPTTKSEALLPPISSFDDAARPQIKRDRGYHSPQLSQLGSPRSIPSTTPVMQFAGGYVYSPNRGSPLAQQLDLESIQKIGSPVVKPLENYTMQSRASPLSRPLDYQNPESLPNVNRPLSHNGTLISVSSELNSTVQTTGTPRIYSVRSGVTRVPNVQDIDSSHQKPAASPKLPQSAQPRYTPPNSDAYYDIGSPRSVPSTTPRLNPQKLPSIRTLPLVEGQRPGNNGHIRNNRNSPYLSPRIPSVASPRSVPSTTPRLDFQSLPLSNNSTYMHSRILTKGPTNLPTPNTSPYLNQPTNLLSDPPIYREGIARAPTNHNPIPYSPAMSNVGSEFNYGDSSAAGTPVSTYSEYSDNEESSKDEDPRYDDDSQQDKASRKNGEVKKKRKFGKVDLEDRKYISNKELSDIEKLDCILQLYKEMPKEMRYLTCGARNFVNRTLNPVMNCLKNHFNDDKKEFILTWRSTNKRNKELVYSRFNEKCKGSAEICPSRLSPEEKEEREKKKDEKEKEKKGVKRRKIETEDGEEEELALVRPLKPPVQPLNPPAQTSNTPFQILNGSVQPSNHLVQPSNHLVQPLNTHVHTPQAESISPADFPITKD